MNENTPFFFEPKKLISNKIFYARLRPDIHKKEQLFQSLYEVLLLPGYFGFNWDALNDCLRDFSWIQENKIVLEHVGLPNIPESELKIYLEILRDAVVDWRNDGKHTFEVLFNEQDRNQVAELLQP